MTPSSSARRFDVRLRLLVDLRRLIRAVDASDILTVVALAAIGAGTFLVGGPGPALLITGIVLAAMTPIGAAFRLLIRGR